jgi:hypothetical protein
LSRQRAKGTKRETWLVKLLREYGFDASRSANNTPSKDVDASVHGLAFAIEVKDRQNLALHATLAEVANRHPDQIPVVLWHRTQKTGVRAVPVGPTLIAMRAEDWAAIVSRREHERDREAGEIGEGP